MHSNTICYFQSQTIDIVYQIEDGVNGLVPSLDRVCKEVSGIIKYSQLSRRRTPLGPALSVRLIESQIKGVKKDRDQL